jgi:hypothetical protein
MQTLGLVGLVLLFNCRTFARIMSSHKKGGKGGIKGS